MKKVTKLLLVFAMMFSTILGNSPIAKAEENTQAETIAQYEMSADDSTYLDWEKSFGKSATDTSDAGRIWTNKSVWNGNTTTSDKSITITRSDPNNFLVGLSAISSNKEIVGEESLPVDVVFVLDLSTSMDNARVTAMTNAVNNAIDELLTGEKLHDKNRVGVVAYNGNTGELLPLDTYQSSGKSYIQKLGDKDGEMRLQTVGDLKDSNGGTVAQKTFEQVPGTNIQGGMIKGANLLVNASKKDVDGVKRIPILVVMSDGEANRTNSDYINATKGKDARNRYGYFFTELTGEYYKKKVAQAYDRDALVYTLGLDVGADGEDPGRSCLDPSGISETSHYGAINKNFIEIFNNTPIGSEYVLGEHTYTRIQDDMSVDTNKYNDLYFNADNEDDLGKAFDAIIQEIMIQSRYYPTNNETVGGAQNLTGYVTFEDEIAPYMEVKKMNGLLFDNNFQDGSTFARGATNQGDENYHLGTATNPTKLGKEFIKSVKERFSNVNDDTIVQDLISKALEDGQISFTDSSNYSNYIAWYADASGNYLGFAAKANQADDIPSGAVTLNRSYFFLSRMRVQASETSLMYISARIEENLTTKMQKVIFKIPSSLVPLVMYNAEVDGDDMETVAGGTITRSKAYPARLFYEVGLSDEVNEFNVSKVVGDSYPYLAKDGKTYSFYSNAWEEGEFGKTTTTFEPNIQNEYYYFVKNTKIYTDPDCKIPLDHDPVENETYYYMKNVFTINDSLETGNKIDTTIIHKSVLIPLQTLFEFKDSNGQPVYYKDKEDGHWYIKIGTPKGSITYAQENKKNQSLTNTAENSIYPILSADGESVKVYHGNNGLLKLEQKSGIMIEKKFTGEQANPNPEQTFQFTVHLQNATPSQTYDVTYFTPSGERIDSKLKASADNKLVISIRENARAYIVLPEGVSYQVTENDLPKDYFLDHIEVDGIENTQFAGTVKQHTIDEGVFFNKYEESIPLTVRKVVNGYVPEGTTFDFSVNVGDEVYKTFALAHNGSNTIYVPKGAKIDVKEVNAYNYTTTITAGKNTGTIENSTKTWTIADYQNEETITYTNNYDVDAISLPISAAKTLVGRDFMDADDDHFVFEIVDTNDNRVALGKMTGTATNDPNVTDGHLKTIKFEPELSFDKPGEYVYGIREVVPSVENQLPGISYATERYRLTVEVSEIEGARGLQITRNDLVNAADNTSATDIKFTNTYAQDLYPQLSIKKIVENTSGVDIHYRDFTFVAVDDSNGNQINGIVGPSGIVTFQTAITTEGTYTYTIKETTGSLPGIDYDNTEIKAEVVVGNTGNLDIPLSITSIKYYIDGNEVTNPTLTNTIIGNASTPITLSGTKTLDGREIFANDNFEFVIAAANENGVETGAKEVLNFAISNTNKSQGSFTWNKTYDKVGTYYYVVSETKGNVTGVNYDPTKYLIQVDVTHDLQDTQLDASAKVIKVAKDGINFENVTTTIGVDALDFENEYTPKPVSIEIPVEKVIDDNGFGRGWQDGDRFTFVLEERNANFNDVISLKGNIALTKAKQKDNFNIMIDNDGTYYYTIRENATNPMPGFTPDTTIYKLKVTATTNQTTGLLELDYELVDATSIVFTNEYNAAPTQAIIAAKKVFNNNTNYTDKSITDFKFTLKNEAGQVVSEAYPNSLGNITFITPELDKVGTYKFTIEEEDGKDGIVYDKATWKAVVEVKDDHQGKLFSMVSYETENKKSPKFVNKLDFKPVSMVIEGKKNLTGKSLRADEFTFRMTESNAVGEIGESAHVIEVKNKRDGTFKFDLTYNSLGVHFYVIEEVNDNQTGVDYDTEKYLLEVNITNDENDLSVLKETHKLTKLGATDTENTITFNNEFTPTAINLNLDVSKDLVGREWLEGDSFTFELNEIDTNFIGFEKEVSGERFTLTSKDQIVNVFKNRTFDEGEYKFELKEIKPEDADPHMAYDEHVYTINVSVEISEDGILLPTMTLKDQSGHVIEGTNAVRLAFENTYIPGHLTGDEIGLYLNKVLKGRDWNSKDVFKFTLTDTDNNTSKEIQTDTNHRSVNIFAEEKFIEGEYHYELKEQIENSSKMLYDDSVYNITILVAKDDNDALVAKVTVADAEGKIVTETETAQQCNVQVEFVNTYIPYSVATGDNFAVFRWASLFILSGIALVWLRKKAYRC